MSTVTLPILHFNDVYRVAAQKLSGIGTIDVTQFASILDDLRSKWPQRSDGKKDGLILFSGDLFAPSVESSVTRGSHMVPVLNYLAPDASVTGNHDFDFGYPHLTKLLKDTKSPWLLSNIVDTTTSKVPEGLYEYVVLERAGLRIGFIGLIEEDWITTISSWPSNFKYRDASEVGLELSKKLRDPNGEHRCDIIIALTHCRVPNDISLAKSLGALSSSGQAQTPIVNTHGVDILLGGHDHFYYCCKGVDSWFGYDVNQPCLGAEEDEGDILVIKSGTDFRELSEVNLEISDTPEGSIRRKIISKVTGGHHPVKGDTPPSKPLQDVLSKILSSVHKSMKAVVCKSETAIDVRSEFIRLSESAAGNWIADVIENAYDDALTLKGHDGADAVIICAGTLRGDTVYGPGNITLGDIMEILPFDDAVVVLELDGKTIWDTLEVGFSQWPATEGRFPVISGFRVTWDSRKPVGRRVVSVHLQTNEADGLLSPSEPSSGISTPADASLSLEEVKNESGGKKYVVVTREYMAGGHDGFTPLLGNKFLIGIEEGQVMSTIVRKYLMGATYIKRMCADALKPREHLHSETEAVILREKARDERASKASRNAKDLWKTAIQQVRNYTHSRRHYRNMMNIVNREHMSDVDCCDGKRMRSGGEVSPGDGVGTRKKDEGDYFVIHPVIDGRLKDLGRP